MFDINRIQKNIAKGKEIYQKISERYKSNADSRIIRIEEAPVFNKVIQYFGPVLDPDKATISLNTIYDAGYHPGTGALVISNKGATLFAYSPKTSTPYLIRHIGMTIYMPGMGIEMVNVGLVGDVYKKKIVLRSESACTPSFLFGSQRCNCAHQWQLVQEIAAHFNHIDAPLIQNGLEFERWVQDQLKYNHYRHLFKSPGEGFVMIHLDSQNGMGSGFTEHDFAHDLYTRAAMRHRGEYTSEQVHKTTMAGGFTTIGLIPDPRQLDDLRGYRITSVVLDYLETTREVVFLSNNSLKIKALTDAGYKIYRLPFFGEINVAGAQEAKERGTEFNHLDISDQPISFQTDFTRLVEEINKLVKDH